MELPALKVGKPHPTPVVRGGITLAVLEDEIADADTLLVVQKLS